MQVLQTMNAVSVEASVKFHVNGYEISLATDRGRPSISVFWENSPRPVYIVDVSGDEAIIDALVEVKNLVKSGVIS